MREEDYLEHLFVSYNHDYLLFFTDHGLCYWLRVYEIPEGARTAKGRSIRNLIQISPDDRVRAVLPIAKENVRDEEFLENHYVFMATRRGKVKKPQLSAFSRPRVDGIIAISIVEGDQLVGLRFRRTSIENGRVVPQDETFERRGCYVISSIGSIPEAIEGIPMKGELFEFEDWDLGRLPGYPTVFAVGNVATGKGNIVASRKHARAVGEVVVEAFLGLGEDGHAGEEALAREAHITSQEAAERIRKEIEKQPPIDPDTLASIHQRVRDRQEAVGYPGDYTRWIEQVTPPDLE